MTKIAIVRHVMMVFTNQKRSKKFAVNIIVMSFIIHRLKHVKLRQILFQIVLNITLIKNVLNVLVMEMRIVVTGLIL